MNRKRLQAWQKAAESCGLQILKTHDSLQPRLEAMAGMLWVRIETCGNKGQLTRVAIVAPGSPDFVVVRIRPEPMVKSALEEIEIGDELFDRTFLIQGPVGMVLALLDAETRRLLLRLRSQTQLEICLGEIRAENHSDQKVLDLLPLLLDVGRRFSQPPDVPRRLAGNVRRDPEPHVRLQSLLWLIREHPREPETVEALRAACADLSPVIRLRAAKELDTEGHGTLLKLAEDGEHDALSAEAIVALDQALPVDHARNILDRALRLRRLQTVHACLQALGRSGAAAAVDALAKVMEQAEGEPPTAAMQALAATRNPAAEGPLILALQSGQEDLRVTAANALGRFGSTKAVLPLKEAAARSLFDLDLRRAARHAIAEIQSRLQGASPGQLSLAGAAEAGQLSLSTDPAGQLSLSGAEETDEEA